MMKKKTWMVAIILSMFTSVYADEPVDVQQGAKEYDWQSCMDSRSSECINDCATSEDIHCKDSCDDIAKDKCLSKGINPPQ